MFPPRRRNSAHPSIVPFQNVETADGWIVVACPKEKFWVLLCETVGRPDLAEEFPSFADRDRRRDELSPVLDEVFRGRTSAEWLGVLGAAGVPCAPVNDVPAALEEARLVEYEHPRLGTVRQVGSPLRLSGQEQTVRPAPARGEHTEQVLVEVCGYEAARIRALAESGVFGIEAKGDVGAERSAAT